MMREFFTAVLIALSLVLGLSLAAANNTNGALAFEQAIEQRLADIDAPDVPGYAYAIVDGEQIAQAGARGTKTVGLDDPVTADTPFMIGSVSKSITAAAVKQLAENGQVDLDMPISQYLKDFEGRPGGEATIRQLLSHTSGYSTLQGNFSQSDLSTDAKALGRRVADLAQTTPAFAPETQWQYSNANYQILGRLVEEVSGQEFGEYLAQNIFVPLQMDNSYAHDGSLREGAASGHLPWFGTDTVMDYNRLGTGSVPQGGIYSSARDMAKFLIAMMNGEDDILTAQGKAAMLEPASEVTSDYGLGWFINEEMGLAFHTGSSPGYEALATMKPGERKGAVVLVNRVAGFAYGSTAETRFAISSQALDLPYEGEPSSLPFKVAFWTLAVLPFAFIAGIVREWRRRKSPRRSGALAQLRLWVPSLLAFGLAYAITFGLPATFGVPYSAVGLYLPDMMILITATAIAALAWGALRLVLRLRTAPMAQSDRLSA